ncbi:MAG: hypothetical protein FJZ64_04210, partial [Chlamydiae bacterium]|nr:hypothetical protein [Chlamydiota bacterium]
MTRKASPHMMRIMRTLFFLLLSTAVFSSPLSSLYSSLDPTSVAQHFAFYELYPETNEGREALKHAWSLLNRGETMDPLDFTLPGTDLQPILSLVNRSSGEDAPILNESLLRVIEKLSSHLNNRKLQGFGLWDSDKILQLPSDQMDLARGLLVAELGIEAKGKIQSYEASLDLMALQILARLKPNATHLEKIRAINDYIFSEMRFRFPPHSLYAKEIDAYTFLPSVLDKRRGVCLGVSILYLCLGQRIGLPLEAITPPGHIFVRFVDENKNITNIETTARGIDVPTELYLGVETSKLQSRSIRECIGLAFMNQAAVSWHKGDPQTAVSLYEKAKPFLENDYLLNLFLGFNYLFIGKEEEGRELLQKTVGKAPEHVLMGDTIAEDYLSGLVNHEGISAVFLEVDETRDSILEKQKNLLTILEKYPKFRQGTFQLAITWMQLGREKEALPILERYVTMNPIDPTA